MKLWSRVNSLWRNLFRKDQVENQLDAKVVTEGRVDADDGGGSASCDWIGCKLYSRVSREPDQSAGSATV